MEENTGVSEAVRLEVWLDPASAREIDQLITQRGWNREEGLRIILGAGAGFLRGEKVLQVAAIGQRTEEELERLLKRLIETESSLASARFRMQELEQANRAWELSTGAIRNENLALKGVLERQKTELQELRKQLELKTP
jgi:hypothetical protein